MVNKDVRTNERRRLPFHLSGGRRGKFTRPPSAAVGRHQMFPAAVVALMGGDSGGSDLLFYFCCSIRLFSRVLFDLVRLFCLFFHPFILQKEG